MLYLHTYFPERLKEAIHDYINIRIKDKIIGDIIIFLLLGCANFQNRINLPNKSEGLVPIKVKGNKLITNDDIVSHIKPDTTSQETILSLLGDPDTVKIWHGTTWVYHYTEIYSYNPFNLKQVMLSCRFDNKGILKRGRIGMSRMKVITMGDKKLVTYD